MSLFGTLMSKIFPSNHPAVAQASNAPTGQQPAGSAAPQQATQSAAGASTAPAASAQRPMAAAQPVDVEQILNDKARNNSEKLNWRTSIVDLMKLVGMDSSLNARKSLAQELHYTGDTNDSAAMNIWLHKQVMTKLAENGGKVPDDLKH